MNIQIFGKNKCFDTKKAERYFKERGVKYQRIDTVKFGMSKGELQSVVKAVGGIDKLVDEKNPDSAIVSYLARDEDKLEKLIEKSEVVENPGSTQWKAGNGGVSAGSVESLEIIYLLLC